MQKILIISGVILLVAGLAWPWLSRLPFGRLPGDISYKGENVQFYFPLATSLLLSLLLSLIFYVFRK